MQRPPTSMTPEQVRDFVSAAKMSHIQAVMEEPERGKLRGALRGVMGKYEPEPLRLRLAVGWLFSDQPGQDFPALSSTELTWWELQALRDWIAGVNVEGVWYEHHEFGAELRRVAAVAVAEKEKNLAYLEQKE